MANRPTDEQLRRLHYKKGKEALICYSWRNALRALSFIGETPIEQIWPDKTVYRVFSVCRALVNSYALVIARNGAIDARSIAHQTAYAAARAIDGVPRVPRAAQAVAYADGDYTTEASAVGSADITARDAALAAGTLSGVVNAAALRDFDCLSNKSNAHDILRESLWFDNEPEDIKQWQKQFIDDLTKHGLVTLAKDIETLWLGKHIGEHLTYYFNEATEAELQTPEDIERLLSGKDKPKKHYAVRVMLMGPGGAGKTSLYQLLTKGKVDPVIKPTVGVEYGEHQAVDLLGLHGVDQESGIDTKEQPNDIQLYPWDFGGQAIFHSLHNAFMHENCIYVLVVDSRHEQAPDEWLAQISHVTNHQVKGAVKVLVVTNWFDNIERQQNEVALIRRFNHLIGQDSFCHFSCQTDSFELEAFKRFIRRLEELALENRMPISEDTFEAMQLVENFYREDNFIKKNCLLRLLEKHIDSVKKPEDAQVLLERLCELGRQIPIHEEDAVLCLRPEWIIARGYQLINDSQVQAKCGMVNYQEMALALLRAIELESEIHDNPQQTFKDNFNRDNIDELVDKLEAFLSHFDLCIKLEKDLYFLPDAAAIDEPLRVATLLKRTTLPLVYDLEHLPTGLKAKMVSLIYKNEHCVIDLAKDVWRDGLIVKCDYRDFKSTLVIEYLARKQRISISVIDDVNKASSYLLTKLDEFFSQVVKREFLGWLQVKDITRESLDFLQDSEEQRQKIEDSIRSIFNFADEHGHLFGIKCYQNITINNIKDLRHMGDKTFHFEKATLNNSPFDGGTIHQEGSRHIFSTNSNNTTTYPINQDQKAMMQEVINKAIGEAANQNSGPEVIGPLLEAKKQVIATEGELTVDKEGIIGKVIGKFWTPAKEANAGYTMIKNTTEIVKGILGLFELS